MVDGVDAAPEGAACNPHPPIFWADQNLKEFWKIDLKVGKRWELPRTGGGQEPLDIAGSQIKSINKWSGEVLQLLVDSQGQPSLVRQRGGALKGEHAGAEEGRRGWRGQRHCSQIGGRLGLCLTTFHCLVSFNNYKQRVVLRFFI
jgi:hypothetical protein